jgi:hypothetical protein
MIVLLERDDRPRGRRSSTAEDHSARPGVMLGLAPYPDLAREVAWPSWLTLASWRSSPDSRSRIVHGRSG